MGKGSLTRILILCGLVSFATNFIHPITPTFIEQRNMPDYMFGVMFAAMALTNFIFSPFWGKFSDKHGRTVTIALGGVFYAVAQLGFCFSQTIPTVIMARLMGGAFTCAQAIGLLAAVVDISTPQNRAKYLAYFTAVASVCTAMGYFAGGLIGDYSITGTFLAQSFFLILSSILAVLFMGETLVKQQTVTKSYSIFNIASMAKSINLPMAIFILSIVFASFGATGHDNAFSFYIKNIFGFPPSYNGIIKASIGIIGLLANVFINVWITRNMNQYKALTLVLLCCTALLFAMIAFDLAPIFVIVNILCFTFTAIYMPIQQTIAAGDRAVEYGLLVGIINSAKGLGMVTGSLTAGFLYDTWPKLPFIVMGLGFALAAVATTVAQKLNKRSVYHV